MQVWAVCVWRARAALLREREAGGGGGAGVEGERKGGQVKGRCGGAEDKTSAAVCGRDSPIGALFSLWVDDGDVIATDAQAPSATANPENTHFQWVNARSLLHHEPSHGGIKGNGHCSSSSSSSSSSRGSGGGVPGVGCSESTSAAGALDSDGVGRNNGAGCGGRGRGGMGGSSDKADRGALVASYSTRVQEGGPAEDAVFVMPIKQVRGNVPASPLPPAPPPRSVSLSAKQGGRGRGGRGGEGWGREGGVGGERGGGRGGEEGGGDGGGGVGGSGEAGTRALSTTDREHIWKYFQMVDGKEAGVRHYGGSECRVSLRDRLLSGLEGGEDAGKMAGGGERVGMGGADAVACQVAAVVRPGEATDQEVKEMMRFLEARLAGGRAEREEERGKHGLLRLGVGLGVGGDVRGAGVASAAAAATSVATLVTASSSDSRFDVQLDASMGQKEGRREATVSRSPPPTPNVGADGGVVVDEDEEGEAEERSLAEEVKVSAGESDSDYEL